MFKKKAKNQPTPIKKSISKSKTNNKTTSYTNSVLVIVVILLIISLAALVFLYFEYGKLEDKFSETQNTTNLSEENYLKNGDLLLRVGRHIRLPETAPQIATVANIDSLVEQQPFFKGAKNGDKVLIYPDKVIVYDEQNDIIVNVGFLINNNTTTSTAATSTEEIISDKSEEDEEDKLQKLTVEVRNGSTIRGLASKNKNIIIQNDNFDVIGVANASRSNYQEGVIVDLSGGSKKEQLVKLSELLGLPVVEKLPPGEVGSPADAVVIVVK